jgi:hypothetical protein
MLLSYLPATYVIFFIDLPCSWSSVALFQVFVALLSFQIYYTFRSFAESILYLRAKKVMLEMLMSLGCWRRTSGDMHRDPLHFEGAEGWIPLHPYDRRVNPDKILSNLLAFIELRAVVLEYSHARFHRPRRTAMILLLFTGMMAVALGILILVNVVTRRSTDNADLVMVLSLAVLCTLCTITIAVYGQGFNRLQFSFATLLNQSLLNHETAVARYGLFDSAAHARLASFISNLAPRYASEMPHALMRLGAWEVPVTPALYYGALTTLLPVLVQLAQKILPSTSNNDPV